MRISQSLIKEVQKPDHCPKQVFYSFIEGLDLFDPSENMLLGRYFESELLGACVGGEKQEPRYLKGGGLAKPFADCLELVQYAKDVIKNLGIDLSDKTSEVQKYLKSETLSGNLDLVAKDICSDGLANYDVKWTATKEDDRWNGWGNPEEKTEAHIQAVHYTLLTYEVTGKWLPFYFLVFGKDKWVKILRIKISEDAIDYHKDRIAFVAGRIKEYHTNGYKGNGNFNKCIACPFYNICEDKSTKPEIETIIV